MKRMLNEMNLGECSRVGTHAVLGRMNVCQWLEFFLLHETLQYYKIFKMTSNFWSNESLHHGNVISMPMAGSKIDEMVG